MKPEEIIALSAVILAVVGAVIYIIRSKRAGKRCVGCPEAGKCGNAVCGGGCHSSKKTDIPDGTEK